MYLTKNKKQLFDFLESSISGLYCSFVVNTENVYCRFFQDLRVYYVDSTFSTIKFISLNTDVVYYKSEELPCFSDFKIYLNNYLKEFHEKGIEKELSLLKKELFEKVDVSSTSLIKNLHSILTYLNRNEEKTIYKTDNPFEYLQFSYETFKSSNLTISIQKEEIDEKFYLTEFLFKDSFDRTYTTLDDFYVFEQKTVYDLVVDEIVKTIYKKNKEIY